MLNLPGASIQKLMNVSDSVLVTDSTSEVRAVLVAVTDAPALHAHAHHGAPPLFPTGAPADCGDERGVRVAQSGHVVLEGDAPGACH